MRVEINKSGTRSDYRISIGKSTSSLKGSRQRVLKNPFTDQNGFLRVKKN